MPVFPDSRIPVTIITGFLGAGKTTLLNQLIKQNEGKKLGIIENEFGEVPIDNELVIKAEDGIFEMSNGCICCSLNDDLVSILTKLVNRKDRIDHLIIETTGIADPGPVANCFLADPSVKNALRLGAIITLVDGQFVEQQLENNDEACKQVALADVVLINKTDRIEEYLKDTIRNIIRKMNPYATIFTSNYGIVENVDLLNLNSFSNDAVLKTKFETEYDERGKVKYSLNPDYVSDPISSVVVNKFKTHKHSEVSSLSFIFPQPLDPFRFDLWIRMTLNRRDAILYRSKGILQFKNLGYKIIFQAVNNQFVTEKGNDWASTEERESKIVFIGKNLDKEYFELGLKACIDTQEFNPEKFYNALQEGKS
jgi:G3E family GTPase